jgi:LysR family transcriptional regulator, nitrogen assimilation regulatory protein
VADFKRLGYFVQVAELGSLTRTAEHLRIAQPSLSRQMRILEEELGVTLFTRGHRGMKLTEAGETLRARIAGPLRQIGHALYEIRSLPGETVGTVTLGMPPTFVSLLGPRLAGRVAAEAPKISLHIVEGFSGHLLEWMNRAELDAAILYGPTPSRLNATKLLADDLVLVGGKDSGLAADPVALAQLVDFPLVLPSKTHGLRLAVESAAAKTKTALNVGFQADSFQLMMELVQSSRFFTVLPPSAVARQVAQGELLSVRLEPALRRQVFVTMQPGAESPKAVLEVANMLRQQVAEMIGEGIFSGATQPELTV